MTPEAFRALALSMPGAHESPHFERTSFRVGRKIFATMTADGTEAMVPVHPIPRCLELLASDPATYLEHGGWTRRLGALGMRLARVDATLVASLLHDAFVRVAPKGRASKPRASRSPASKGGPRGKRR